jgi:hypothetical protein
VGGVGDFVVRLLKKERRRFRRSWAESREGAAAILSHGESQASWKWTYH